MTTLLFRIRVASTLVTLALAGVAAAQPVVPYQEPPGPEPLPRDWKLDNYVKLVDSRLPGIETNLVRPVRGEDRLGQAPIMRGQAGRLAM